MDQSSATADIALHDPIFDASFDNSMPEPGINLPPPDFGFYIDETVFEGPCEAENCNEVPPYNQNVGFVKDQMLLQDFDYGIADLPWKQATMDSTVGKCHCSTCSKIAFENDVKGIFNLDDPDLDHVLTFQLPDSTFELEEPSNFSTDLSLLDSGNAVLQNGSTKRFEEASRNKSRAKRRKKRKSVSASTAEVALSFIQDVVRSEGTISESLFVKMKQLTDEINSGQKSQDSRTIPSDYVQTQISSSTRTISRGNLTARPAQYGLSTSRTPRPPVAPSISSAVSSRHRASTVTMARPETATQRGQTLYQCTFKNCMWSHTSRYEWRRHEMSVHKHRCYMCKECGSEIAHRDGGYACGFCLDPNSPPFPNLEAVRTHTLQCAVAREAGASYSRKDRLRTHLRQRHGMRIVGEDAFEWVYNVGNEWQECGFCGIHFDDWDFRASHVEVHFIEGADITSWTVPFRRAAKKSSEASDSSASDDDDDDDDEDEDEDQDNNNDNEGRTLEDSGEPNDDQTPGPSYDARGHTANNSGSFGANWNYYAFAQTGFQSQHRYMRSVNGDMNPSLERFSVSEEQHERLLLGLGRRPLRVIIGAQPGQPRARLPNSRLEITEPGTTQGVGFAPAGDPSEAKRPLLLQGAGRVKTPWNKKRNKGGYVEELDRVELHRIPDNDFHYVMTTTSRDGRVQVHDHKARRYDPQEPLASEARYEDYKSTQYTARR